MREIKFKVWSIKNNEMFEDVQDYDMGNNLFHFGVEHFGKLCSSTDFILLQYIGLEDKIGKEVYEGDVVETRQYIEAITGAYYVLRLLIEFDNGAFVGKCIECTAMHINAKGDKFHVSEFVERGTIIGNIYETPELITPNNNE